MKRWRVRQAREDAEVEAADAEHDAQQEAEERLRERLFQQLMQVAGRAECGARSPPLLLCSPTACPALPAQQRHPRPTA